MIKVRSSSHEIANPVYDLLILYGFNLWYNFVSYNFRCHVEVPRTSPDSLPSPQWESTPGEITVGKRTPSCGSDESG